MYQLTYDSKILFDPYMQSTAITDAKYTGKSNSVSYLDFTIAPNHPLYNTIEKDKGLVEFYSDNVLKFRGKINEIEIDGYGYKIVSCNSVLQYLNHTRVRSYSTVHGDADLTAPTSVEGYFQWLIDQHNLHVKDASERFEVGVNQGAALDKNDYILRSNDNYPTTLDEINYKVLDSLGGYLFVEYKDDRNILNLYADVHSTNSQIIDFGSNILSISYKENDDELYTVVIPRGGTPEKKEGDTKDPKPINIKNLPDNTFDTDSDIVKSGDCVYSLSATKRYGYREYYYSNNDILDPSNLLKAAVLQLRLQMSPKVTIETKAIDLSIAYPGYEQLNIGDACRVRSARHNLDDYFMLSEMELDLNDPSQTTYTFGDEYVSLVGRQSNYLKQINSSIDRNYEDVNTAMNYGKAAAKLADTANKTADAANNTAVKANDKAQKATEDAFNANTTANKAQETANTASAKADSAQSAADKAQSTADSNKNAINAANAEIEAAKHGIAQAESEITTVNGRIETMNGEINTINGSIDSTRQEAQKNFDTANAAANAAQSKADTVAQNLETARQEAQKNFDTANAAANAAQSKADSVGSDLESFRTETNTTVQNVRDSVSKAQSDVDAVAKKTSDLSDDLDATKATVSQTVTEFGEVKTTATNAASKADQSLQVSTQASQTATSASQKATSAYNDAQTAITKSSEAVQTANSVSLSLKTDYQTKADADAKYATQSSLTATSDQIKTEVSKTYATKATVDALENIANNAVQTWTGKGAPTLNNKPASDWNTAVLKTQHSGDIYYDTDTGYSYRFGSSDGSTYSWTLIKDTDISKAIADAAKAQKTADSATSGVSELKSSIPVTYATKTELTQKADSITSRVEEVAQAGTTTSSKVTQLEQKTDEIKSTVSDQGSKLDNAVTTISKVSQKANSISTSLSQTNKNVDALSTNMLKNPGFETGGLEQWTVEDGMSDVYVNDINPHNGSYKLVIKTPSTKSWSIRSNEFTVVAGHTYDISVFAMVDEAISPNMGIYANGNWTTRTVFIGKSYNYRRISVQITMPIDCGTAKIVFGFSEAVSRSDIIRLDDFEIRDITEGYDASGTANSALSKASTLEQSLDGFKTTVSQTYETKNDSLSKQSALAQTIDGFKSEVSKTYETKTDASNKQSSLEQSLNGFKTTVSQTYETKDDALKKQTTLNQTIDGFKTNVSQMYETKSDALAKQSSLNQTIDGFKATVSQTYATKTSLNALSNQADVTYAMSVLSNAKNYWIRLGTATISEQGRITQLTLNVSRGNNGRPEQNAKVIIQIHRGWDGGDANHQFGVSVDNANWKEIQVKAFSNANNKVTIWVYNSVAMFMKGNYTVSGWRNSWEDQGLTQTGVPAGTEQQVAMNVSLEDVNNKATSALTKSSELEQTLDGFKATVSQTYETKSDALSKQSTINQKVNSLRSEVSETYATKTQLNNASSTTNMWPNQWFDTSKRCIGRAPVGNEIEAAPVGGNIRIIDSRDHYNGSVSSQVMPGRKYKVSVDAKKISGTKSTISGGIWYTSQTSGNSWDGGTDFTKVKDYGNNWYRFERTVTVPGGKTMGAAWLQLAENTSSSNTAKWKISNLRFEDVTDIADIQANYSTKSYVDQTARTVSLGVVEEYKKGQHGSALATASDITAAKDSITSTVSQTYASKSEVKQTYATQSLVQQTSQQWGVQLNQLSTATDNAIADVNNALDNQSDALTATSDKIDDEITKRRAYMNFTQDDNGNPLLELGASRNTNKVDITNEKVSFQSEGSEVAYISNKELHINNATIVQKLIIGNNIGFIPRADGHLTLTRI